jgi:hypothetical protein
VNGNHRTLALEALGVPLAMAEVRTFVGPYSITFGEDDDWSTALEFLRWLEERHALRMSTRAVHRSGYWIELRVAEATTPWLASSPYDALRALAAYEAFFGRKVEGFGQVDRARLLRTWQSTARNSQRKPVEVITITVPKELFPSSRRGNGGPAKQDSRPKSLRRTAETPPQSPY